MRCKFRLFLLSAFLLVGATAFAAQPGLADPKQEQLQRKASEFVTNLLRPGKIPFGQPIDFVGLTPLPADLEALALRAFPKHRFSVGRLKVAVDSIHDSHILVVRVGMKSPGPKA